MLEAFSKLVDKLAITLAPLLAAVWISCALALYLPDKYPWFTPARAVIAGYTGKIQLALIASSAYLIVLFLGWLRKSGRSVRLRRKSRRLLVDRLSNLTRDEKLVLQQYILRGCRTWCWEFDDPNVRSLVAYGILFPTSSLGDMRAFSYDVADVAWKHLNAHPELIHLPESPFGSGAPVQT